MANPNRAFAVYTYFRPSKSALVDWLEENNPELELVGTKGATVEADGYWWPVGTKFTAWAVQNKETGAVVVDLGKNAGKKYSDWSWADCFNNCAEVLKWETSYA